eukprot:m.748453 g.748453  ORF g.748453 m.748453 type:complete len:147 (-) comp23148_c0_seq53:724-1164(-)
MDNSDRTTQIPTDALYFVRFIASISLSCQLNEPCVERCLMVVVVCPLMISGTTPKGSTWAQNPIPRIHFDSTSSGQPTGFDGCQKKAKGIQCRQFKPYACPDEPINPLYNAPWHAVTGEPEPNTDIEGMCSGDWVRTLLPLYTPPS